jgi:hypothetical protein
METRRRAVFLDSVTASKCLTTPFAKDRAEVASKRSDKAIRLQTATTTTTLSPGGVGRSGGDILNTADLHAGAGKGTESGLGTRTGGLGRVAWYCLRMLVVSESHLQVYLPPVARILMWRAVMPSSLQRMATS